MKSLHMCTQKPQEELYLQQHILDLKLSQYFCPLCRQLSNAVVPLFVPAEVINASRSHAQVVGSSADTSSFSTATGSSDVALDASALAMDVDAGSVDSFHDPSAEHTPSVSSNDSITSLLQAQFADEDSLRCTLYSTHTLYRFLHNRLC